MRMEVEYPQEVNFVLFHNFSFKMEPQRPRALIVCHYLGHRFLLKLVTQLFSVLMVLMGSGLKKVSTYFQKYFWENLNFYWWPMKKGKHTYLHILTVHLDDFCGRGTAWDTWKNLGHPHHDYPPSSSSSSSSSSWPSSLSPPLLDRSFTTEFIETGDWDSFPADLSWVDFRGDWGNQLKMVSI